MLIDLDRKKFNFVTSKILKLNLKSKKKSMHLMGLSFLKKIVQFKLIPT